MMGKEDIHDYRRRLASVLEYLGKLESKDLNASRIAKYATTLLNITLHMGVEFKEAKREGIKSVVRWINESDFEPWTKYDYKGILKRFYKGSGLGR
jgi:hypothetical protein